MISRLRGTVRMIGDIQILLDVQGVGYDVLIPSSILNALKEKIREGGEIELVTFHYHQLEPSRGVPVLIGFLNEIERDFFLRFISVSGVGPRAAVKALAKPIPVIAQAIDEGQVSVLKSLPGIGEQRAKEIVAKLQGKVGKFALMPTHGGEPRPEPSSPTAAAFEEEAVAVLMQLEYTRGEARDLVKAAFSRNPNMKSSEDLLNEIYRQKRLVAAEA